jgi:hypothetical protein
LGLFLQVVDPVEFKLIVSQLVVISPPLQPPQMSTLLKPLSKNWIKMDQIELEEKKNYHCKIYIETFVYLNYKN